MRTQSVPARVWCTPYLKILQVMLPSNTAAHLDQGRQHHASVTGMQGAHITGTPHCTKHFHASKLLATYSCEAMQLMHTRGSSIHQALAYLLEWLQ